jgi:hypothetical protein
MNAPRPLVVLGTGDNCVDFLTMVGMGAVVTADVAADTGGRGQRRLRVANGSWKRGMTPPAAAAPVPLLPVTPQYPEC